MDSGKQRDRERGERQIKWREKKMNGAGDITSLYYDHAEGLKRYAL